MRYSVQPRDRIFVKGCGFLSFAKNMAENISENQSLKSTQKLFHHAKTVATDALKTTLKKANRTTSLIQKQLQMNMIKKYLKKDIYFQKKGRKSKMI